MEPGGSAALLATAVRGRERSDGGSEKGTGGWGLQVKCRMQSAEPKVQFQVQTQTDIATG